jgi:uncharacterized protein YdbL (DUF1318 family)
MKLKLVLAAIALAVAGGAYSSSAGAQSPVVDQARAQGIAGERYDGYMGVVGAGTPALRSAIGAINIQRRSLYSRLAAEKGATPQEVGLTAGCQLLARVAVGQAYLLSDGTWRRRAAGEGSVAPAYCR